MLNTVTFMSATLNPKEELLLKLLTDQRICLTGNLEEVEEPLQFIKSQFVSNQGWNVHELHRMELHDWSPGYTQKAPKNLFILSENEWEASEWLKQQMDQEGSYFIILQTSD